MLKPKTTLTRTATKLDGYWMFSLDNDYINLKKHQNKLEEGELITVPSSYNNLVLDKEKSEFIGLMIYERELIVRESANHKSLYFGAVTHDATVYINGQLAKTHIGGFLPFEVNITDLVSIGTNRITVVVDNRISPHTLPCGYYKHHQVNGYEQDVIDPNFDFLNYTGINRSVFYVEKYKEVIKNITISTKISGLIEYQVDCEDFDGQIIINLYDEDEKLVASNKEQNGTLEVSNPTLWDVRNVYLYKIEVQAFEEEKLVDSYNETIGIRERNR